MGGFNAYWWRSLSCDAVGYKCRLDENSWLGANRRILENELLTKQHMLANVEDLDRCCERAGVTVTVEVKAGLHPKMIVVEEAKKHGAYHVVLDRCGIPLHLLQSYKTPHRTL